MNNFSLTLMNLRFYCSMSELNLICFFPSLFSRQSPAFTDSSVASSPHFPSTRQFT